MTHPQNRPPPVYPDPQALRYPRPDVPLAINYNQTDEQQLPLDDGGPGGS
jgi:hypothetical protein